MLTQFVHTIKVNGARKVTENPPPWGSAMYTLPDGSLSYRHPHTGKKATTGAGTLGPAPPSVSVTGPPGFSQLPSPPGAPPTGAPPTGAPPSGGGGGTITQPPPNLPVPPVIPRLLR